MKVLVTITHENGSLSYVSNTGNSDTIGILEATKYAILRSAFGGVGRPPSEPDAPASGGVRAPGLSVRKVG